MLVCLALFAVLERGVRGFNLDTDVPIVKRSGASYDTYFGFSVAAHWLQQSNETVYVVKESGVFRLLFKTGACTPFKIKMSHFTYSYSLKVTFEYEFITLLKSS